MQETLNLKIKFRESFRPFAPSVLRERGSDYFELNQASPYMLLVASVKESLWLNGQSEGAGCDFMVRLKTPRSTLPAITHVDYSARIQTVAAEDNPRFHRLLSEFERRTSCAVLVNTSFNVRGEPPVCTPEEAFRCFMRTEMDYLVLGNFLLDKAEQLQASRSGGFPTAENKTAISKSPLLGEEYQKLDRSPRALRRFGLMVGSVILFLGCVLLWRHRGAGWPLISIGTILVFAAGLAPLTLKWVHGAWMIVALALGWIITRILLTIVFFFVVTPIGSLQRLFAKRVIEVAFKADAASYWQTRTARPMPEDYEKQF